MNSMDRRVTIIQIAEESKVSIATVSRVMNGSAPVSPKTKKRVERVIKKYNFSPNAIARSLLNNQTQTLGLVLPDIANPYFSSLFLEIERFAMSAGYSILLCNTLFGGSSHDVETSIPEAEYFRLMLEKKVDGVILTGGEADLEEVSPSYLEALSRLSAATPVVVIGEPIGASGCRFIRRESTQGVRMAVDRLAGLGHERIAFVGGQAGVRITGMRLRAYEEAMESKGLSRVPGLVALSDYYIKDGYEAMIDLLGRRVAFTAMLAINDMVALGALRSLSDRGLRVPEDVAMISCDQFFTADYTVPRLSGVAQENGRIGRLAIQTLISVIKGEAEPEALPLRPELSVRESCGGRIGSRKAEA